jgi:peptidyl-prolyl cis-trans isomerase A (cyclophilin A)/peptidyl-prolyl cis-trans isomerase B (cyclophilin B)
MRLSLTTLIGVVFIITANLATASDQPKVRVETNAGDFVIELDAVRAPLSVKNFLQYVEEGFYPGTLFHRVVSGFVVQAGGYSADENPKTARPPIPNESGNGLSNQRMTVAMARTNDPHSADSQFFVNLNDNVSLDPKPSRWGYAVFGKVISGAEVIDDIGHRAIISKGQFPEFPAEPVIIENMELVAEPDG